MDVPISDSFSRHLSTEIQSGTFSLLGGSWWSQEAGRCTYLSRTLRMMTKRQFPQRHPGSPRTVSGGWEAKRPYNAGAAAQPSVPSSLCFGSWNKWACQRRCPPWPCVPAEGMGLIMRLASCWAWGGLLAIYEHQCGYLWKRNNIPFDIWLAFKGVHEFQKGWYDMEFKLWSSRHGSPVRASGSAIYNWRRKHAIVSLISNLIFQNDY